MKNYTYHIKLFFQRFLLLISIFSISRFLFYFFNLSYFSNLNFLELLKILIAGIRFDISSLFYFNIIFILLSLIPGNFKDHRVFQKITFLFFIFINALLLATNYIDTKFFDFENKRLTSDIFSGVWLGEDFKTLLPEFIKDYWYLVVIWILSIYALHKIYPKFRPNCIREESFTLRNLIYQIVLFIFLLALGLLGGRGGFQYKPLNIVHAAKYTSARNVPLVLNTPFTIMKSLGAKSIPPNKYFNQETLDSIYSPINIVNQQNKKKANIVIFILESFSKEYIGYLNNGLGYTPFLDSLMTHSLVFPNAFANGKRSIEAVTSIAAGIPSLQNSPYITSQFSSNTIKALPEILNELGYNTSFFHGGKNGTMNFNSFASLAGYSSYYGMTEFNNEEYFDGKWGIFDEEFLYFWGQKLSEFKQPFFSTLFTLTSHHPYPIPEKYKGKFPKGNLNIHETIGYTDFALKQYFKSIKNKDWYNNTLFIFVADHTAQAEKKKKYNNNLGMYSIPIFFYHPTDTTFQGNSNIIAQQTDISPTILDYISYDKPFICFGNSLLNDSTSHFSINFINGIYQLIENEYLIQFDGERTIAVYNFVKDEQLKNNLLNTNIDYSAIENKIKAIIQSYQERMVHNKLIIE